MKTLISITCLVILSISWYLFPSSNAELDKSILIPYADNELVVIGRIIQVDTIISENKTEYIIDVEKYLKNSKSFDMITAFVDGIQNTDFVYTNPIDYYNKPFFEKENQVFVYLNKENGKYKISPYSFALEKNEPKGPPSDVIWPTAPIDFQFNQGEEIVISGLIKKAYLYQLEQRDENASINLKIFDKNNEPLVSEKLQANVDGIYEYPFQIKGKPVIPGKYSYEIQFGSSTLNDEFIIEVNPNLWTPLKQFKAGIPIEEIKCKENLQLIIKNNGNPACVSYETAIKLNSRGWSYHIWIGGTGEEVFPDAIPKIDSHQVCMNSDKKLVYEGTTHTIPYIVKVTWNPYDLKTSEFVNFEIQMFDVNFKPLQNVTYDLVWKTGPDSGVIDDRYVADFGKIDFDVLPIKTGDPCYIAVSVHIDKIAEKSYKRDPLEVEKFGNMSPVGIQFHHYAMD